MKKEGYDIGEVEISVGTTYEAVGEARGAVTPMRPVSSQMEAVRPNSVVQRSA